VSALPDFAAQHPPFATVFYLLVDRAWPGLDAAALATVAAGCLGLLVTAGLARDELGDRGERVAVACSALAPVTVLYLATSADAMWAPVLAGAALAADRGLRRRSWAWTVAGGVLLWLASMVSFAAALVLPFLAVRALAARAAAGWGWVLRWAAATSAVVLGLGRAGVGGRRLRRGRRRGRRRRLLEPGARHPAAGLVGVDLRRPGRLRRDPGLPPGRGPGRAAGHGGPGARLGLVRGGHRRRPAGRRRLGPHPGEVERMWQFLVPFAVVVAARQLLRWRAGLPLVAGLLLGQALAIQVLFYTRW